MTKKYHVDPRPTLNTLDAAEALGVHRNTLLEWVKRGNCPIRPLKIGSRFRWPVEAIEKFLHGDQS